MNLGKLVGVVAIAKDGRSFVQHGALLVFGVSYADVVRKHLARPDAPPFQVRKVYAEEIFASFEAGGDAWAFDVESFKVFDPLAAARCYSPVGTFLFSFEREPVESDAFVIFAAKNSLS